MKTKIISIIALAFLAFAISACSFSTANISDIKFGKNDTAKPAATSFNMGEKVFTVATVSNAMGKHKLNFNLKYDNVAGKTKGDSVAKTDVNVDGDSEAFFSVIPSLPGTYAVDSALIDEQGKEISKKSGTFTVTGTAPTAPAATKPADSTDHDTEGKDDK